MAGKNDLRYHELIKGTTVDQAMRAYNTPFEEEEARKLEDKATRISGFEGWTTKWKMGQEGVIFAALQCGPRVYVLIGKAFSVDGRVAFEIPGRVIDTFRVERKTTPAAPVFAPPSPRLWRAQQGYDRQARIRLRDSIASRGGL